MPTNSSRPSQRTDSELSQSANARVVQLNHARGNHGIQIGRRSPADRIVVFLYSLQTMLDSIMKLRQICGRTHGTQTS
jgi:hypothetical protein